MSWNLEGHRVSGTYLHGDFAVSGLVELSRVKYGGAVEHTVVLDHPLEIYGDLRDRVLLSPDSITEVYSI